MALEEFPGGPDTFLVAAKFCYSLRVEFTPRNIVIVYCAADYLEMTDEYGEDPSLFGWPMMMYGRLQSPGGSILWNGINTGAKIQSLVSDWWFEDISYLDVGLFERLIQTMEVRGIRPENLAGAIMYYARKYLPGLGRWQGGQSGKSITVASFSMTPAAVDQRVLLQSIIKLLPKKKGKSFCRFLLGLLRVALILGVNHICQDSLERRIGMQLELATLDSLLIPTYSDSDTLYNTDCVERIIHHFISSEPSLTSFSPSSFDLETSPSSGLFRNVAKLIDGYIAEVASDMNLKPGKIRSLAESLPESSRSLHDGLYRALDIYFKAHPCLPEKEKEQLCNIINYQKLSIDACAHASQNERLPLRVVLQVLFFEQLQLRTALGGCPHALGTESARAAPMIVPSDMAGQIIERDGWVTVVRENQVLKVDMEKMRSRVRELEEEFSKMKQVMKRVTKSHSSLSSPRLVARRIGCKLLPQSSDAVADIVGSTGPTPRASVEKAQPSCHSSRRKSFSLF
ncbi:hypothetical protein F0562_001930 [Nyssa sinensis]|uniref:NPH3 domain-containing protein n=1 Tax=Nyssa sinensis TaxID=561372 RepID=A0A5J5C5L7_9ASTE|nr:hypothetical protein F0562_001930 [Nyssa sinensis]